jgi:dTDP-4-amino-4,6-dideoxygalactose transaminase
MDELQAAVLSVKLGHLDDWNATRRRLADRYRAQLPDSIEAPPRDGVFHLFVVKTHDRDALKQRLAQNGIGSDVHYPLPAHLQTPYVHYANGPLPNTERLAGEVLSLPMYPELEPESVDYVCRVLQAHGA